MGRLTPISLDRTPTKQIIITPITTLGDNVNHGFPRRVTTIVDKPRKKPTTAPEPNTTRR